LSGMEEAHEAMLEEVDPVDLLLASKEPDKSRPFDFVRAKFLDIKRENRRLRERVASLEQTLSIVQTSQEWVLGKGMTQEQAEKMKEIRSLLEQAKRAREDVQNFSTVSKPALFEKLRACKAQLQKERDEKREMKERLVHAFDRARVIKEHHQQLIESQEGERKQWQELLRITKEKNRRAIARLHGDGALAGQDRQEIFSQFGEQVMQDITALQQHLKDVRRETVDDIMLEGEDLDEIVAAGDGEPEDGLAGGDTVAEPEGGDDF